MRIGLGLSTKRKMGEYVRLADVADAAGFDTFWIPDMAPSSPYLEPYVVSAAVAAITEKILIGVGVSNPYSRHPAMLARTVASLIDLSDNRFILGIGAGGALSLKPLGFKLWENPYENTKNTILIIQRLLAGKNVNIETPLFKINNLVFNREYPREVKIYMGARGPRMLELAGRIADGVIFSSPAEYIQVAKKYISQGLSKRNKSFDDFELINWIPSALDVDANEALNLVKPRVGMYLAYHSPPLLKEIGFDETIISKLKLMALRGDKDTLKSLISDDLIERCAIYGTPEHIIDFIELQEEIGVSEVVFGDPFSLSEVLTIDNLRKTILSTLKEI